MAALPCNVPYNAKEEWNQQYYSYQRSRLRVEFLRQKNINK